MRFIRTVFKEMISDGNYNKALTFFLVFALVLIFAGIGLRSPWPADEPRFAEAAREMVSSGHWLIPMRGGEAYPDKPPLFMWIIALFYWVTGNLKIAFLLPSALASLMTLFFVFDLGARLWNVNVARTAAFLLLLFPQFLIQAKAAQIDAMVTAWVTLGCYGLLRHFLLGPNWKWYFIAWAAMGLGVITKGVGFLPIFMLIPLTAYHLANKIQKKNTFTFCALYGPLVMLIVVGLWLIPMLYHVWLNGSTELIQYRNNILFKQTAQRYINSLGHVRPWYYLLVNVIMLWFPAILLLLAYRKKIITKIKAQPKIAILFFWVILVVMFFSFSPGKRGVYILPALPMFSLGLAACISPLSKHSSPRWFERLMSIILWGIGIVAIAASILTLTLYFPSLTQGITENLNGISVLLMAIGVLWLVLMYWLRTQQSLIRMGAGVAMVCLMISFFGYPLLEPIRTPAIILKKVEQITGEKAELGLIDFKEQFILFSPLNITHFGYSTTTSQQERNAWQWIHEDKNRYILTRKNEKLQCFDTTKGELLGQVNGSNWILLSNQDTTPECQKPRKQERFSTQSPARWIKFSDIKLAP